MKHLHHEAKHFDIGIYFESNGHGTVLFSPGLLARLAPLAASCPAAACLLALARMINQAVGDGLSVILLVETALRAKGWGLDQWQQVRPKRLVAMP